MRNICYLCSQIGVTPIYNNTTNAKAMSAMLYNCTP